MPRNSHEVLDPVHGFIHFTSDERRVIDSRPLQRLRSIHQLGLGFLLYPGANHTRFEHSLGTMELAGRVFDVITTSEALTDQLRGLFPDAVDDKKRAYWRSVLRMAALCHDIGHPPFSHTAESLFPLGWSHERMTVELILSEEMRALWQEMIPPLGPEHVAKVAVGSKGIAKTGLQLKLTDWESILAEVISGEAFGVDRMDYLLRDSLHLGVAAGTFGYQRLIESLRILEPRDETNKPLTAGLGINYGGRHSAHELLVARGFMYSQVYYHPVNRSYRLHLIDFLAAKLSDGKFAIDLEEHLASTDTEVTVALTETAKNPKAAGHDAARRIICRDRREHFRLLDERRPGDADHGPTEPGLAIYTAASEKFGAVNLRHDHPKPDRAPQDFYVQTRDGTVVSSATFPDATMPKAHVIDYIFVAPEIRDQARQWLKSERDEILRRAAEAERETDS